VHAHVQQRVHAGWHEDMQCGHAEGHGRVRPEVHCACLEQLDCVLRFARIFLSTFTLNHGPDCVCSLMQRRQPFARQDTVADFC
jgi:hypothetical protein